MSKNGDVVWADGRAWQRDNNWEQQPKQWWTDPTFDEQVTLKDLKEHDDFIWLVYDGELVDGIVPAENWACKMCDRQDYHEHFVEDIVTEFRAQGMYRERQSIVKWLRLGNGFKLIAAAIERGAHHE